MHQKLYRHLTQSACDVCYFFLVVFRCICFDKSKKTRWGGPKKQGQGVQKTRSGGSKKTRVPNLKSGVKSGDTYLFSPPTFEANIPLPKNPRLDPDQWFFGFSGLELKQTLATWASGKWEILINKPVLHGRVFMGYVLHP